MKKEKAQWFMNHVNDLRTLAGLDNYHDALILYKRLHRIEARVHRLNEESCNGYCNLTEEEEEKRDERILKTVRSLLPGLKTIFLNGDPRGYSLKISSEEVKELRNKGINFYSDWGGYGILAPEF